VHGFATVTVLSFQYEQRGINKLTAQMPFAVFRYVHPNSPVLGLSGFGISIHSLDGNACSLNIEMNQCFQHHEGRYGIIVKSSVEGEIKSEQSVAQRNEGKDATIRKALSRRIRRCMISYATFDIPVDTRLNSCRGRP
jgi:hypothetical protein